MSENEYLDYKEDNYYHLANEHNYEDYEYVHGDDEDNSRVHADNEALLSEIVKHRLQLHSVNNEVQHLCTNCVGTTVWQGMEHIALTLCVCFFLRILLYAIQYYCFRSKVAYNAFHLVTVISGSFVIQNVFTDASSTMLLVLALLLAVTYFVSWLCHSSSSNGGLITAAVTVLYIILAEVYFSDPSFWNRLRGVLLLISMKIISLSFDANTSPKGGFYSVFEFCSYCLHPGFLVYGPWISISDYQNYLNFQRAFSLDWLLCVLKSAVYSCVCLVSSVCVLPYIFVDPVQPHNPAVLPIIGSKWMISYCTALSFHFSHYYISYLAVLTSSLSGVGGNLANRQIKTEDHKKPKKSSSNLVKSKNDNIWSDFRVTKPWSVEVPRSMLNVVVAWNIPMSKWLKMYVFDVSRFLGDFPAILFTYAASAMLHGLSLHLAAVLLSLGFYTYTEHALRYKLSKIFRCPEIQARPPKTHNSDHRHQRPLPLWATLFNLAWIVINLMHLAYLGSMFQSDEEEGGTEGYSINYTLSKWGELGFLSHWFALGCFVVYFLI